MKYIVSNYSTIKEILDDMKNHEQKNQTCFIDETDEKIIVTRK